MLKRIRENDEITFEKFVFGKIDFREFVVRENGFRESDKKASQTGAITNQICTFTHPGCCI